MGEHASQCISLTEYARKRGLYDLLEKARKYLPSLPDPNDICVVEDWEKCPCSDMDRVIGCAWIRNGKPFVSFREYIPDHFVFLHELIHLAGGGEMEAYNYTPALWYAVINDVEPFNLLDLRKVNARMLDEISMKLYGMPIVDLLITFGVIPSICIQIYSEDDSVKAMRREELMDNLMGQCLLANILSALEFGEPYASKIFDEIINILKNNGRS